MHRSSKEPKLPVYTAKHNVLIDQDSDIHDIQGELFMNYPSVLIRLGEKIWREVIQDLRDPELRKLKIFHLFVSWSQGLHDHKVYMRRRLSLSAKFVTKWYFPLIALHKFSVMFKLKEYLFLSLLRMKMGFSRPSFRNCPDWNDNIGTYLFYLSTISKIVSQHWKKRTFGFVSLNTRVSL